MKVKNNARRFFFFIVLSIFSLSIFQCAVPQSPVFQKDGLVLSIPDAIAKVLENKYLKGEGKKLSRKEKSLNGEVCPECGEPINFEEGCMTCHFCGYTLSYRKFTVYCA